tara:strand:- start:863 stop:1219 length:357 start_codon:yes stop_codon:yes gene_type:complete
MMRNRTIFLILLLSLLLACTTTQEIVVDDQKINSQEYSRDLQDCRRIAGQIDAEGKVLKGAGSGAVIGGVSGTINDDALRGIATGGLIGGVKGFDEADKGKLHVVKNCLRHRGYIILN